ncbi:ATP-binding protein [Aestuariivirga sp.]|uniref:ATP-binding protein n=1 Tax=Aestuariivirga sp. TaxID=2650926 RepID=UPI00391D22A1
MDRAYTQSQRAPAAQAQPFERVGRIVAVTGAHAIILIDPEAAGERNPAPEMGTLLKIDTPRSVSLCMVSALSSPMPSTNREEQELRIIEVEFLGEIPQDEHGRLQQFRRGISCYPSLGDVVFRATRDELERAYACDSDTAIRVGYITQDSTIPAMIKIDEMLGKHFAILGTTGTGKSCTVALILRRILEKNPQAHVLLLDVHREYANAFSDMAEVINPENMNLPFWLLNFEEIVEILIGQQASREGDIEVLRELIPLAKLRYMNNQRRDRTGLQRSRDPQDSSNVGVDTPIPYRTSDLIAILDDHIGKLDLRGELAPYKRLKSRIESISRDPRYAFMFGSLTVQDTMSQVLARLFRIPVNGKPIAILELGGLPSEIINVVVSVLARLAFDFGVWSAGQIPITFICEEAHRYVPIDKTLGFEPTKRAISRIAKEGRKYGVSLCIVSQRPAELDPTILSQCNTIFSMRLTNERDQQILRAGISDAAGSLLEFMPTMGTGEAITFGEGVALPTRIKFDTLPARQWPRSNTASFTRSWARELPEEGFLQEIVLRWRAQSHTPEALSYDMPAAVAVAQKIAQPAQPTLRRTAQQGSGPPPPAAPAPVPSPPPQVHRDQQKLADLIRQFRS